MILWSGFKKPDPITKYKQETVKNSAPVPNGHSPFFRCFSCSEENRLHNSIICWERELVFGVFSDLSIQVFNQVGGIDDFTDFSGVIEEDGEFVPIVPPAFDGIGVF